MNCRDDDAAVQDDREACCSQLLRATGQTAYKRDLAYRRLGITPNDVQYFPFLAIQFRRIARAASGGGMEDPHASPVRPLEYLEFSDDPEARKVLEAYRSVPKSYRQLLRPEDYCHAAGVSPWKVLEIVAAVAVRQTGQAAAILGAMLYPRVVVKTIERALQPDAGRERLMIHNAVGFLTRGARRS